MQNTYAKFVIDLIRVVSHAMNPIKHNHLQIQLLTHIMNALISTCHRHFIIYK